MAFFYRGKNTRSFFVSVAEIYKQNMRKNAIFEAQIEHFCWKFNQTDPIIPLEIIQYIQWQNGVKVLNIY